MLFWRRRLEMERKLAESQAAVDTVGLTLKNIKADHTIELNKAKAVLDLKTAELEQEHDLKTKETETLLKLRHEQQIAQIQLTSDRAIDELKSKHQTIISELRTKQAEDMAEYKTKLAQEFYDKVSARDNQNTDFVMAASLKLMEKPSLPAIQRIETKHITSKDV